MASDKKKPTKTVLKVTWTPELHDDVEKIRKRTGLKSEAEVLRYALRHAAQGAT